MILNLRKLYSQQEAMFSSLRDRAKTYLAKYGYHQKQMAEAIGVSETHMADFLSAKRGLSETPFVKLEHILSLNANQRKLQFYKGGNTDTRMCNLQSKVRNIKGQIKFDSIEAIEETHAAFSKFNQDKLEV
jgi:transcriptional regulator with XRE-family HTH domain